MKKIFIISVLLIIITGCSSAPSEDVIQTAIAQTSAAQAVTEETVESTSEPEPTNTVRPTNTSRPTNTARPTNTPTIEPTPGYPNTIARNYLASDEDNGVIVEVARILIAQKDVFATEFDDPIFEDKTTLVMFIFKITNNTDQVIDSNFYTGTAAINGEQIKFEDYWWVSRLRGDNLSDEILPGSTVIGGLFGGIKRSSWDEVETIVMSVPHFFDDSFSRLTSNFLFTIDVDDWEFEPLPDELQ
jgi:hypothetical protein